MTYQSKGFVETRRDLETTEDEISAGSIVVNTSVREFPMIQKNDIILDRTYKP